MPPFEECKIRVRYADTDQMGVVYYANYLVYFEVGRTEFCRHRGISYAQIERDTGSYLIVAEARCRYRRPLRYDQEVIVRTFLQEMRRRTLTFAYQLIEASSGTICAEGETVHVVTDQQGRPRSFPDEYRRILLPEEETTTSNDPSKGKID
ncbi:MAG: acyl-CoA thioesterase [Acidobacteria bacterium]|nr:MAG: acyl-CoA thioesterase [Acidobacteriota bacterium]